MCLLFDSSLPARCDFLFHPVRPRLLVELNRAAHFGYGNLLKKLFATSAAQQRTQDAADDFPSDGGADGAGDAFGCGLN